MQQSNIAKVLAIEEDDEGKGNYSEGHAIIHCWDASIG